MRAGSTRLAQDWARAYAEGIDLRLRGMREKHKGDVSELFPFYPDMGEIPRGQGIRYCQEINLAKKQADERERLKAAESQRQVDLRAAKGLETGPAYQADIIAWTLRTEEKSLRVGQEKTKQDIMIFCVSQPVGRSRGKGIMFEKAMNFLVREGEHAIPAKPKVDPFTSYMADVPAPRVSQPEPKPEEPAATPDAQEDLLSKFYKE